MSRIAGACTEKRSQQPGKKFRSPNFEEIKKRHKKAYKYSYFLPEKINHGFIWTEEEIGQLLEKASLKLGELNSFSKFVPAMNNTIEELKTLPLSNRL